MKVFVRSVTDHDVLDAYFGEEPGDFQRPVVDLGKNHGELMFEGNVSVVPNENDVLVFDHVEYFVVVRLFDLMNDQVELIIHPRQFGEGEDFS